MFDLATAYIRTGLTQDPANDLLLEASLDATLAAVENYLDRYLLYDVDNIEMLEVHYGALNLRRYPIDVVTSMIPAIPHQVHNGAGMILLKHRTVMDRIEVTYSGGYKILPADLELALWLTFDALWALQSGGTGGAVAAGTVESVTISGVGTVRYATGGSSSVDTGLSGTSTIPDTAIGLLRAYRRKQT